MDWQTRKIIGTVCILREPLKHGRSGQGTKKCGKRLTHHSIITVSSRWTLKIAQRRGLDTLFFLVDHGEVALIFIVRSWRV